MLGSMSTNFEFFEEETFNGMFPTKKKQQLQKEMDPGTLRLNAGWGWGRGQIKVGVGVNVK